MNSAKIYVNTDILPTGNYKKIIHSNQMAQKGFAEIYNNLAVGVCHAQEIDLLVDSIVSKDGVALTSPLKENKIINEKDPALLLLTSPQLDLNPQYPNTKKFKEEQVKYITGMYLNLFQAAVSEGRHYIVMPAAGLGRHGGNPVVYFAALMNAAKKYPTLNIIYHAGDYEKAFDEALTSASNPGNIARTTKDIIFVAAHLLSKGKACAIHNPSTSDSIYGLSDVGEHWQTSKKTPFGSDPGKTLQAYVGTVTTAPLGSYGINYYAYKNITENQLIADTTPSEESIKVQTAKSDSSSEYNSPLATPAASPFASQTPASQSVVEPQQEPKDNYLPTPMMSNSSSGSKKSGQFFPPQSEPSMPAPIYTAPAKNEGLKSSFNDNQLEAIHHLVEHLLKEFRNDWSHFNNEAKKNEINILSALLYNSYQMSANEAIAVIRTKHPELAETQKSIRINVLLNKLDKQEKFQSCFSDEQLDEVNQLINRLNKEIRSSWPYPNKELKKMKVEGLKALIDNSYIMDVTQAIATTKQSHPRLTEGQRSTRVADLITQLESEAIHLSAAIA